ncbi:hypothetical protein P280DRAFT_331456 [Massarina eburnea CBS 473.64]|uniref:WW domain-containing protein n=1 Tax=Massarina eburnea CBS 473.64 TaxID=1395130 RepID=A0A6A6RZA5_9PLEO|nr:hypothetical protein P280DRAFT_331456 [Massarina eburnea CBS 473.64]
MAEFAPPPGPPPPKVPEGWKAIWNAQYSEWFYVNIYTKQSQWEKPTEAIYPSGEGPPDGPPPYSGGSTAESRSSTDKKNLGSNNPYAAGGHSPNPNMSEDEKLARQLQEEEEANARGSGGSRGAADDFYHQNAGPQANQYAGAGYGGGASPYPQSQSPYQATPPLVPQEKGKGKKGLFSSLLGGSSSKPAYQQQGYPQQGYPQQGYGQPAGGYYGAPQQGYYPQQQGMYGRPQKKPGMGAGGAAALGVGGGLLAGGLLGDFGGGDF